MSSPNSATDPTVGKHSFLPVTKLGDGTITAITSTKCDECHDYNADDLNTFKALHAARIAEFRAALEDNSARPGIFPNERGNMFYTTAAAAATDNSSASPVKDWQTRAEVIGGIDGYDLFGICNNFNLLNYEAAEPGAWAHNSKYVGRLIYDAIEALSGATPSTTNFPDGRP